MTIQWFFYFMNEINELKEITSIQLKIVRQIKDALNSPLNCDNTMYTSIWFDYRKCYFYYQDRVVPYKAIKSMIDLKVIKFISIGLHQNEKMLEYSLSNIS